MNPETESFLKQVRHAERGSAQDEERVLVAVRAAIGAAPIAAHDASDHRPGSTGSDTLDVGQYRTAPAPEAVPLGNGGQAVASGWLAKLGTTLLLGGALMGGAAMVFQGSTDMEKPVTVTITQQSREGARHAPGASSTDALPSSEPRSGRRRSISSGSQEPSGREPSAESDARSKVISPARPSREPSSPSSSTVGSVPAAPLRSLAGEVELLRRVQAALAAGDGVRALRLLDRHATEDRQFHEERQAARILALCLAGQRQSAREAARRFERSYPGSVHHQSIARSCAIP